MERSEVVAENWVFLVFLRAKDGHGPASGVSASLGMAAGGHNLDCAMGLAAE